MSRIAKFITLRNSTRIILIGIFLSLCLYAYGYAQGTETVTITTYYPSPQGTYRSLRLFPNHQPPPCDSDHVGALHYDDGTNPAGLLKGLYYCTGSSWQAIGGGGGNFWTQNGNALYPNNLNWNVGAGTSTPQAKFTARGSVLFVGSTGTTPVSGAGTRFMWIPAKGALRAGEVSGTQWDDANIGNYSVAMGYNTTARGEASIAMGYQTAASNQGSIAMGEGATASGVGSIAFGYNTTASGNASTAFGNGTTASGLYSTAFGEGTTASGRYSTAFGEGTTASGDYSIAMGLNTNALALYSFASGYNSRALAPGGMAFGHSAIVNHSTSMVVGLTGSNCTSEAPSGTLKVCGNMKVIGDMYVEGGCNATGTKQFKIPHPDPTKPKGTFLKHTSVESPTAGDNLYRWTVTVVDGQAVIALPDYYKFLNKNDMVLVCPVGHFGRAQGKVDEKQEKLIIYANSDGKYNVLLIGTRKDKFATEFWKGPEVYIEPQS